MSALYILWTQISAYSAPEMAVQGHSLTLEHIRTICFEVSHEHDRGQNESVDGESLDVLVPSTEDIRSHCAKWILKISETRSLTRRATIGIVEDTASLISFVVQLLRERCSAILAGGEVEPSLVSHLEELFCFSLVKPFDGLMSFSQQLQYYREHFTLIVSIFVYYNTVCHE